MGGGLLSSSCCVLQLILNLFSFGCAGFKTLLEPYRPLFLSLTFGGLIASLYLELQRNCSTSKVCGKRGAMNKKIEGTNAKKVVSTSFVITTLLVIALAFSPEMLGWINDNAYGNNNKDTVVAKQTVHMQVGGMNCEGCRNAVQRAVNSLPSVISSKVDLKTGKCEIYVDASGNEIISDEELEEAVRRRGFTAQVIQRE